MMGEETTDDLLVYREETEEADSVEQGSGEANTSTDDLA